MPYRILADENVEPATRNYLAKLGHDIVFVPAVDELGESAPDGDIAAYSRARQVMDEERQVLDALDR